MSPSGNRAMLTDSASSSHKCDGLQQRRTTPTTTRAPAPAQNPLAPLAPGGDSTTAGSWSTVVTASPGAAVVPVDARDKPATDAGNASTGRARRRARWMNDTRRMRLPVTPPPGTSAPPSRPARAAARLGCRTPPSYSWTMGRQLVLLDETSSWRLDEASKEQGRRGLAAARAALAKAVRRTAA